MIDVFEIKRDFEIPDVETQADNAIKWVNFLYRTAAKHNSKFLGNLRIGYSCLGLGHKLLDIPYDIHDVSTKEFQLMVGIKTEKGAFDRAIKVNNNHYKSIYHLGLDLSFRRVATTLRKAHNIRAAFKEEVAEIIIIKTIKRGRKKAINKILINE